MKRYLLILLLVPTLIKASGIQVGTNLVPFALKGWSGHVGLEMIQMRFEVYGAKRQDKSYLSQNDAFEVKGRISGFYVDYLGEKSEGTFGGMGLYRNRVSFRLESTNEKLVRDYDYLSGRIGYKWLFKDRFFITPWLQYDINIGQNRSVVLSGQTYQAEDWIAIPALSIGVQI